MIGTETKHLKEKMESKENNCATFGTSLIKRSKENGALGTRLRTKGRRRSWNQRDTTKTFLIYSKRKCEGKIAKRNTNQKPSNPVADTRDNDLVNDNVITYICSDDEYTHQLKHKEYLQQLPRYSKWVSRNSTEYKVLWF